MHLQPDAVGKIVEEIMTEDAEDVPEQTDGDILSPEYHVDVGRVQHSWVANQVTVRLNVLS